MEIEQQHEEAVQSCPNVIVNPFEESYYKDLEYYYNKGVQAPVGKDIDASDISDQQPEWAINYLADSKAPSDSDNKISTLDLISWSFQTARGMQFLASQNAT